MVLSTWSIEGRAVVRMTLVSSPRGLRMVTEARRGWSSGRRILSYSLGLMKV